MANNGDYTKDLLKALDDAGISMENPAQDAPKSASKPVKPATRTRAKKADEKPNETEVPKPQKRRGRPPKNVRTESADVKPEPDSAPEPVKPEEVSAPTIPDFGSLFGKIDVTPAPEPEPVKPESTPVPTHVPEPVPDKTADKEAIYAKMRVIQDSISAYRDAVQKFIAASDTAMSALQDELVSLEAMIHG